MSPQLTDKVLLVRPASFSFNSETALSNAFQSQVFNLTQDEVLSRVTKEFDGFVDTLTNHGVEVLVIDDSSHPLKPDAIFPNNWISMHSDGSVVLYPMLAANRRAERRLEIIDSISDRFVVNR